MNQVIPRLWIASSIALACLVTLNSVRAQIVPDNTLPVNSTVTPGCTVCTIDGGTVRGVNLFHSFREFGVPTGGEAFFNNGLQIQNIFSRVTGNSVSNIDGVLRANGTANLFLLNPNGIIFGPNASLNIGGSFVASTASRLLFTDGTVLGTKLDGSTPPLLSVSVPLGLQYGSNPEGVEVRGAILGVDSGQTLALVGGNVQLNGGKLLTLSAPLGMRVELGGLAGEGTIGLSNNGSYLSLSLPNGVTRGDVSISNGALVDVRSGGGGSIAINTRNLNITRGSTQLLAGIGSGFSSVDSKAGDIEINATQAINLDAGFIFNVVTEKSVGNGGDINITTGSLAVIRGAQISAATFGQGDTGDVIINARDTVAFDGVGSDEFTGAYTRVQTGGIGKVGNIKITTGALAVTGGAFLSASTDGKQGTAGSVIINARDTVTFDGVGGRNNEYSSAAFSSVEREATGEAGEINITTGSLAVTGGAFLSASTDGKGNAGDVIINARDTVTFDGVGSNGFLSGAFSRVRAGGSGTAGKINITTGSLAVTGGAQINASNNANGKAGSITINARDTVAFDGSFDGVTINGSSSGGFNSSGAFSSVGENGIGEAGAIEITTRSLSITNRAEGTVSNRGTGNAGNLEVTADSIYLNNHGKLTAESVTGEGGDIKLTTTNLLLLRRNSLISAISGTLGSNGIDGNINIDTKFLIAVPKANSDIVATGFGRTPGSNIEVNAESIFGTQFRQQETPESDILASGTVKLNISYVDSNQGLVNLPSTPVDHTNQINQVCSAGATNQENKFTVTGRRGLPQSPNEVLTPDMVQDDFGIPVVSNPPTRESVLPTPTSPPKQLVEAQGWVVNDLGVVTLVAAAPTVTPLSPALIPPSCQIERPSTP